jgi:carboxyl-terminal processing protease
LLEKRLKDEGAKGLVLDLRTANGSLLQPVTLLADALLDGGVMWKSWDAQHRLKEYKADRDCLFRDMPMAVLVDGDAQSLPVLLAAALQDRGRAKVIGETPRQSAWVTSLVHLPDGQGAMMLRTGTVERTAPPPEGPVLLTEDRGWRLIPDHEVLLTRKQKEALVEWHVEQERTLEDKGGKMPEDPQLNQAIAVLRKAIEASGKEEKKEPK